MDGLQFGRWLHERRRKCGFSSQRTLVEYANRDPALRPLAISEAFLARLEAGLLAHPFRGKVRQRVLALAEPLCKTARDVNAYLRAAELSELDVSETEHIALLRQRFQVQHKPAIFPLPPRPANLVGREELVQKLIATLSQMHSGLCLVTGMPGVGKSVLAAEVIHILATSQQARLRVFPDGVAAFPCAGYQRKSGLLALLEDIIAVFDTHTNDGVKKQDLSYRYDAMPDEANLTKAINRVRLLLVSRSMLILLDDVDAHFPLQQAMGAILGQSPQASSAYTGSENGQARRVILATSRSLFSPAIVNSQVLVEPLEADAALAYFLSLLKCPLKGEELAAAREIVAALGYLPLAIEMVASVAAAGMSLSLLASRLAENPFIDETDSEHSLFDILKQAFAPLNAEMRQRYALLATSGIPSFGLESAAALCATPMHHPETPADNGLRPLEKAQGLDTHLQTQLTDTALNLAFFARHSLVDLVPSAHSSSMPVSKGGADTLANVPANFHFHPILRAYASRHLGQLKSEDIETAGGNIQTFALAYLERYGGESKPLMRERDVLWAAFLRTARQGYSASIVQFAQAMAPISCRLNGIKNGTYLFQSAISASQSLHDRYREIFFLWGLGRLYCQRGDFALARQTWSEALEIAAAGRLAVRAWVPLLGLAHLAHLHYDEDLALSYAQEYAQHCLEDGDAFRNAFSHTLLARYARLQGNRDNAYRYVNKAMSMLPLFDTASEASLADDANAHIRMEMARIVGDFITSQKYAERAATYLEEEEDYYFLADLLLDQAYFAQLHGQHADTRRLVERVMQASNHIEMPYLLQQGKYLLQHTAGVLATWDIRS